MRRRTRLLVAGAALAAGAATATTAVLLAREPTELPPVSPAQASAAAQSACTEMTRFEQLVRANAPLDRVRERLGAAERQARTASRGDAAWLALAGGVQSVRLALDADDARAARVGIDVVRSECRRLEQG